MTRRCTLSCPSSRSIWPRSVTGFRTRSARSSIRSRRAWASPERVWSPRPRAAVRGHRIGQMAEVTKFLLGEDEIPTTWVNLLADLPGDPPPPPLNPQTGEPAGPDDLSAIFPMGLIEQEVSTAPEIEIPDEVREIYRLWRPTPLFRALRLERGLDTPPHIYYKHEGVSPAGSHKPNTAGAPAYFNKQAGIRKLSTETGAGQWGSALAPAR